MFNITRFKLEKVMEETVGEIIDYGVKMVGAPLEWSETMGENINVGIIDTGIDLTHLDLKQRVKKYKNFVGDNPKDVTDENGHGTHVAGIIAASKNNFGVIGVAPMANLYIAKAFNARGNAADDAILDAVNWMIENHVHIVNMSFSSAGYTPEYHEAVKRANEKGIIMVCAAGNSGTISSDTVGYPAKFEETISVTAVDMDKKVTAFSSRGVKTDIAAAGYEILSCYPVNSFARLSGTSMATPIISCAAAILQNKAKYRIGRFLTPEEMKLIMCIYTEDIGKKGKDDSSGCGIFSFGRIQVAKQTMINEFLNGLK